MTAESIIKKLQLIKHPEGGFYRETYRSEHTIIHNQDKKRNLGTAIYYLLNDKDKSHFHRIKSDELWLFHLGEPLIIYTISQDRKLETKTLGNRLDHNEEPQILVAANTWFAAEVKNEKGFALISCIVTPGFNFDDFEIGNKEELIQLFPEMKHEIEKLAL